MWLLYRSPDEVTQRVDRLIATIRELQRPVMQGGSGAADVVLVRTWALPSFSFTPRHGNRLLRSGVQIAHGHILRAFTKRWLRYPLEFPLSMMLEPGGVGILRFVLWEAWGVLILMLMLMGGG